MLALVQIALIFFKFHSHLLLTETPNDLARQAKSPDRNAIEIIEGIGKGIGWVIDGIGGINWSGIGSGIMSAFSWISRNAGKLFSGLGSVLKFVWNCLKTVGTALLGGLKFLGRALIRIAVRPRPPTTFIGVGVVNNGGSPTLMAGVITTGPGYGYGGYGGYGGYSGYGGYGYNPVSTGSVLGDVVTDVATDVYLIHHPHGILGSTHSHNLSPHSSSSKVQPKKIKKIGPNGETIEVEDDGKGGQHLVKSRELTQGTKESIPQEAWQNFTPKQLKEWNSIEDKKLKNELEQDLKVVKVLQERKKGMIKNKKKWTDEDRENLATIMGKMAIKKREIAEKIKARTHERIRSVTSIALRKFNIKLQEMFDMAHDPVKRKALDAAYERLKIPDEQVQEDATLEIYELYQSMMNESSDKALASMKKIVGDEFIACGLTEGDAGNPFTLKLIHVFTILLMRAKMVRVKLKIKSLQASIITNPYAKFAVDGVKEFDADVKKLEGQKFGDHDEFANKVGQFVDEDD